MRLFLTVTICLAFFACSKEKSDPNAKSRDISGAVAVYDEFGTLSHDDIGITVTLSDGTSVLTTQTYQNGLYTFSKVPYGKYNLSVSRNGFGTNKRLGIQHQHPKDSAFVPLQLGPINLVQICSTTINYCKAAGTPNGAFDFWIGIFPATTTGATPRYYRMFVGTDSLVGWDNAEFFTSPFDVTGTGTSGNLSRLPDDTFPPGSKAWLKVYGDSYPNTMYYDSAQEKFIFPCMNMNTMPATSFIVQ